MSKYTDIMLDIETFGTWTNAAIVQIGAVAFNADGDNAALFTNTPEVLRRAGAGFRMNVDLANSEHPGVIDPSTVEWWLQQSDEARSSITKKEGRWQLGSVLHVFVLWVEAVSLGRNKVRLWSNGPTFDEMIVRQAFERYSLDFHEIVSFRQSRCCRTLTDTAQALGWTRPHGGQDDLVAHDGLDDAVAQARAVVDQRDFLRRLKGGCKSCGPDLSL